MNVSGLYKARPAILKSIKTSGRILGSFMDPFNKTITKAAKNAVIFGSGMVDLTISRI